MGNTKSKSEMEAFRRLQTKAEKFEEEKDKELQQKLQEPWRKFGRGGDWTREYRDKLQTYVKTYKVPVNIEYTKILLLGPVGAGKSSFLNSISSIDKDRIANMAISGKAEETLSTKLMQFVPSRELAGQYRLLDTMGIEESEEEGFNVHNVIYLIEGNLPHAFQFKRGEVINPTTEKDFIMNPKLQDKPHCIVILMDSQIIDCDGVSEDSRKKLKTLQTYIRDHAVPTVIVLTKIDVCFEEDKIDVTGIYKNRRIKEIVSKAASLFGVPEMNVFPVQNYMAKSDLDDNMDILLLLALQRMIDIASDRLEYMAMNGQIKDK